jgi:peptide/nickel transport system substrate-binding protein
MKIEPAEKSVLNGKVSGGSVDAARSRRRRFVRLAQSAVIALAAFGASNTAFIDPLLAQTTIRLNENAPGDTDPARSTRAIGSILFYNIYDTLLLPGEGGQGVQPHLAESYTIDGDVYTFKLRHGVKFVSGNELTAEDVVFSLERLIAIGAGPAPLFKGWVKSAEAVDKYTVRITTTAPYAPFLAATFRLGIVEKAVVLANLGKGDFGEMKDYGQAYLVMNSAGTGAYRIVSHAPQTQTVLEKNPNYFLPIPADAPDRVVLSYGVEQATQVALMRRGELDIMSQWASPETKRTALGIEGVSILGEAGLTALQIKLNTTRAPLDDVHCRRALALGLDYETLASLANISDTAKGARVTNGPLLNGMLGYDPNVPVYKRDMDAAKAELAQCKYKAGDHEMEIVWLAEVPLEERFALLMQQNWGELGFSTKINRVPVSLYYQSVANKDTSPHVSQIFPSALSPDPDSYLSSVYGTDVRGQPYAAEWLSDEKVDELLAKGRATIDPDKRAPIYSELAARLRELQPSIWAYESVTTYPKSAKVSVPLLEEPGQNLRVAGMNMMFRMMKVVPAAK